MAVGSISNQLADVLFATKRLMLGHNRVRRTRLYCVGTGKSGTHSITSMFSKAVRAQHEPEAVPLMEAFLGWKNGRMDKAQFTDWLRARDRRLALEVDSSTLNREILDILLVAFPEARFVLTIRDCYSWCNSHMNHAMRFRDKTNPLWREIPKWRMGAEVFEHAPEERLLKEQGLASLHSHFCRWAWHNAGVLEQVPPARLLVVRTDEIGKRAFEIAEFAGLPRRVVRVDRTHEFRNPVRQNILAQIDPQFVESAVEKHCRALMSRFFPEIKSLRDAKL
jgi:hypothetical protein